MTDESRPIPNSLDFWQKQVGLGIRYLKEYSTFSMWNDLRKTYRHQFDAGLLPYNITYSTARTIVPSVYYQNPYIIVSPRKLGVPREHAYIVSSLDNWLLEQCGIKQTLRKAVLHTFLCGLGPIKTGYEEAITRSLTSDEDIMSEVVKTKSKNEPINRSDYNIRVREEMPWAVSVQPEDVVFPWGTADVHNCPWVAHRVIRPLDDLKANKAFKTQGITGTHIEFSEQDIRKTFYNQASGVLDLIEYWDISDYKHCERKAFIPGEKTWLLSPTPYSQLANGLDWEILTFADDSEYIYNTPEAAIINPEQREINECKTQEQMHRKIALLKLLYKRDSIKNIGQLLSGEVMPAIPVDGNPSEAAFLLQPHIPPDFEAMVRIKREEVRELTGVSQPSSGQFTSGRKTATEVSVVHGGYNLRMGEKRDRVGDVIKSIINKFNDVVFERWTQERVVEVLGVDGAMYWVKYTPEAIKGDYDIKIDVDSLSPTTKTLKRKEMMELLSTMAKMEGANVRPLVEELAREYGWGDVKQLLPQAPETQGSPMGLQDFQRQQGSLASSPSSRRSRVQSLVNR